MAERALPQSKSSSAACRWRFAAGARPPAKRHRVADRAPLQIIARLIKNGSRSSPTIRAPLVHDEGKRMTEGSFEGVEGVKIFTREWQPTDKPRGVVVISH